MPGPSSGQVQGEASGGAGDPCRDGDEPGSKGCGGRDGEAMTGAGSGQGAGGAQQLNAMVARASQAALAVNTPDGRCASGPFLRSAMTCSTTAWARWVASASSIASGESVN